MIASVIPEGTIAAYTATRYRVNQREPFALKIGKASAPLRKLYEDYNCSSAAFITTWNPYSMAVSADENTEAQSRLEDRLIAEAIPFIAGIGEDPSGQWSGETSVLALGLSLDAAKSFGVEFLQNAIVWAGDDSIPKLILLR
jgi:hypothetical protein